ncbi:hypothetical protein PALP01_0228 [Pseudomonas phage PA02]|uniref:Uncharacterized protein n=2 Tax=root TaxID=1 RepID=A0AAU8KX34_9VIRU|nr:hypothetical protein PALP01_0228 [Pseudomonas phage PA02]
MTLQELRELLYKMESIHAKIKQRALAGDSVVNFDYNNENTPVEGKMNNRQAKILRKDGYIVEYNSACLWYEVKGWDD